jgi:subtilisin family serine protease
MMGRQLMNQLIAFVVLCLAAPQLALAQEFVPGELIIKLKGKSTAATAQQFMGKVHGKMNLKSSISGLNMHRFSLKAGDDVMAKVSEFQADPLVEYAEPNYILRKVQANDMVMSEAFGEEDMIAQFQSGDTYTQSNANTGVTQAWPLMRTLGQYADRPIVAVIDTGVNYNHTKLVASGAMWVNAAESSGAAGVDDDGNGYIDDIRGYNFHGANGNPMDDDSSSHGTHVAGIVLGVGQNIFHASPEPARIRIMALKFLGADGSGSTSNAVSAIYYAVNNGAQVINNSWGGSSYSQALHDALTYAYERKVFIASAAGNYTKNNDTVDMYPANYPVPGQVSVAASTDSDALSTFSNYGATKVHVAAPGSAITSLGSGNTYRTMSGTSMASPFVAGLAALVLREAPQLTGYQIKSLISNTVTYVGGLSTKVSSQGRTDVYDAIVAAQSEVNTTASQPTYKAENRAPASSSAAVEAGPKGCGLVGGSAAMSALYGESGSGGGSQWLMILALTLIPLIVWQVVRARATGVSESRRKFERYQMSSEINLSVGGRQLTGQMSTISEGGLSFAADALLEKGGVVTIQIQSPDGKETVEVAGRIVWSEQNKAYGVQFDEAKDAIRGWTAGLSKARG